MCNSGRKCVKNITLCNNYEVYTFQNVTYKILIFRYCVIITNFVYLQMKIISINK